MNYIQMAKNDESIRREYQRIIDKATVMRNANIRCAFKGGSSQKEIASAIGLSESRVKKIIGELKKQDKK